MNRLTIYYPSKGTGDHDADDELFDLAMTSLTYEYNGSEVGQYYWFNRTLINRCVDHELAAWSWEATSPEAALWLMMNAPAGYEIVEQA